MTEIQEKKHLKLSEYLNQIYFLKALQGLGSTRFTPGLQLQRQLTYAKCLILDILSNVQIRALKKRKLDSNPRYDPDITSS